MLALWAGDWSRVFLMMRTLPAAVALLVLLVSGLIHGLWTDRWRAGEQPGAWAARLDEVPRSLGDWEGNDLAVEAKQLRVAEATGCLARNYVHRGTGATVSVTLVCGRSGPIAVHTPDVCYRGSGHGMLAAPVKYLVPLPGRSEPAQLWTAVFRKDEAMTPTYLRIFWAWSAGGAWTAPANPRLEFARYPALYKLYVIHPLRSAEEPVEKDLGAELLPLLLPELQRTLFAPSS